jgi:hypothetical protein
MAMPPDLMKYRREIFIPDLPLHYEKSKSAPRAAADGLRAGFSKPKTRGGAAAEIPAR